MKYEYWFITLPVHGSTHPKGMSTEDQATVDVNELAARGWQVVNATRPSSIGPIGFMLRRKKTK